MIQFIVGIIFGGLISWYIAHKYYIRAGSEQRNELERLKNDLKPKNTLGHFERYLMEAEWEKTVVNFKEVWICTEDNIYQIHQGEKSRDFSEPWTYVHPDPNAYKYSVYLKIGGITIKQLVFVSVDGGRIFVPLPEHRLTSGGKSEYFWNTNSLEVKVCHIIGDYYRYGDLEGIASKSGIEIVD